MLSFGFFFVILSADTKTRKRMELLLHYCWKHKIFPLSPLTTTDGHAVEVLDPGLHNTNAGPDFFNAKVKINDTVWVGNVEIHDRASDWFAQDTTTTGITTTWCYMWRERLMPMCARAREILCRRCASKFRHT